MAIRDGVLLLMALVDGLPADATLTALVEYLRSDTTPSAVGTGTVSVESADVLVRRGDVSAVAGSLAAGATVSCWRLVGEWWFVSTVAVAGWVHESWIAVT